MTKRGIVLLLVVLGLGHHVVGREEEAVYPGREWGTKGPEEVGLEH